MTLLVFAPVLGIAAGVLTTVAGQGGGLLLLLVLSHAEGPHAALAATAPALLFGNVHRAYLFRRAIDRPLALRLGVFAVPGAVIGGLLADDIPPRAIHAILLGLTTLAIARALGYGPGVPRRIVAPAAGVVGALTGAAGGAGVLFAPLLLAAGLTGPTFVGTSSVLAALTHAGRVAAYGASGLFDTRTLTFAGVLAVFLFVGNATGRHLRGRLSERAGRVLELTVLVVCVALSVTGAR